MNGTKNMAKAQKKGAMVRKTEMSKINGYGWRKKLPKSYLNSTKSKHITKNQCKIRMKAKHACYHTRKTKNWPKISQGFKNLLKLTCYSSYAKITESKWTRDCKNQC